MPHGRLRMSASAAVAAARTTAMWRPGNATSVIVSPAIVATVARVRQKSPGPLCEGPGVNATISSVRQILPNGGVEDCADEAGIVQTLALVAFDQEVVPAGPDHVAGERVERQRGGLGV